AHVVPGLIDGGPMQRIRGLERFAGIEPEPPLTTGHARAAIPRNTESLQASPRKIDQVLLKWRNPEGVLDFVIVQRAVRAVGPDHELSAVVRESRGHTSAGKFLRGKITQDADVRRRLHRQLMVRSLPALELRAMALAAELGPDKGLGGGGSGSRSTLDH